MKLIDRTMVDLKNKYNSTLFGHIALYELSSGNWNYMYYIEEKFYYSKVVDPVSFKIIQEESSESDYHYSVDISFSDKSKYLGWEKGQESDLHSRVYKPILCAK